MYLRLSAEEYLANFGSPDYSKPTWNIVWENFKKLAEHDLSTLYWEGFYRGTEWNNRPDAVWGDEDQIEIFAKLGVKQ